MFGKNWTQNTSSISYEAKKQAFKTCVDFILSRMRNKNFPIDILLISENVKRKMKLIESSKT